MSATIAAALKKIAVAILTNPKVLKTIGGIVLGIVIIIIMPIITVISIFNGDVEIDYGRFEELVFENLSEEDQEKLELMDEILQSIETEMEGTEFADRYKEAQTLYLLGLVKYAGDDDFVKTLMGCFAEDQTDEQLVEAVNETFGSTISADDFSKAMERYRNETSMSQVIEFPSDLLAEFFES